MIKGRRTYTNLTDALSQTFFIVTREASMPQFGHAAREHDRAGPIAGSALPRC